MTFENTVSKILEEGRSRKKHEDTEGIYEEVDETKEVCRDRSVWRLFSLTTPLVIKREAFFHSIYGVQIIFTIIL